MANTNSVVMIDNILGKNGFVEFNCNDIVANGGKFEFKAQSVKLLPANEGILYQSDLVKKAWSKVESVKADIRLIRADKSIPKAKVESKVNALIHDRTGSEMERRTLELMIKGAENYRVAVIHSTVISLTVEQLEDGTFVSHCTFEKSYMDKDGDKATTLFKKPIFMDKATKKNVRITQEEIGLATGLEKKSEQNNAVELINLLNNWHEVKLENSGRFDVSFEAFKQKVEKSIADATRYTELYMAGKL
ncbi:MAG: hypothetical protein ACRCX2_24055 [Paraclostridium sp.]